MPAAAPDATAKYVRMFEEAEQATYDSRLQSEKDRDYYDGNQLTAEEVAALQKRGQPPLKINRIRRKIDWLKGLEIQRRTDPKAFARNPSAEHDADAATDAIRFVSDNTDLDRKRTFIGENMWIEGVGGCEVIHKTMPNGQIEIEINEYPWDRLFWDPHSSKTDFSDARYKGAIVWMDEEELLEMGASKAEVEFTLKEGSISDTYDDKPKYDHWADRERKRCRVVMLWYKEKGGWYYCVYHYGGVIDKGESPYVNEDGETVCPLIMGSTYVSRDNDRYGIVRDMRDPQDEINKRRSKALHQLTMRQAKVELGDQESLEDLRRELARPDGIILTQPDSGFEVLNQSDLASGQMALLQESKAEIDMMGANSALEGEGSRSQSGRAIAARQQGGLIEIAAPMDNLHWLTKTVYEHIWMRIRQFWTEERWIRVTDDERNVRFVGLNRPMTLRDELQEMPEEQAMQIAQQMRLRQGDPRLGMVTRVANNVSKLEVDIILEEVPDQVTLQAEEFQSLANLGPALIQANPAWAPLFAELMIESAPGLKADTRDKLREGIAQMQQQQQMGMGNQQQMAAIAQQMEMSKGDAEVRATRARAAKDEASAMKMLAEFDVEGAPVV